MNLNQSNIDRALGDTPASFSACMQSTLNHCVEARRAPHQACQKQQGVPFNFHGPPYERCSICRIKNSHGLWEF